MVREAISSVLEAGCSLCEGIDISDIQNMNARAFILPYRRGEVEFIVRHL